MDPFFFSFSDYTSAPYYCRINSEACCPPVTSFFSFFISLRRNRNAIHFLKWYLDTVSEEDSVVGHQQWASMLGFLEKWILWFLEQSREHFCELEMNMHWHKNALGWKKVNSTTSHSSLMYQKPKYLHFSVIK